MTASPHKKPLDSLSIFFPCYNDAGTIGDLIAAALRVAEQISYDYEVLVIDDKSADNSRAVIEDLLVSYPKLKAVFHERNRGYGGVLKTGFAAASKKYIFYTDGDGQYSPLELAGIAYKMTEDVHAVNGFKIRRADSWYRLLLGTMYNKFVRFVFGIKMREVDCDFRLIRRSVFNHIKLESENGAVCTELVKKIEKNGFVIIDVPVHHFPRLYGSSQFFNFRNINQTIRELMIFWWKLHKSSI